MAAGNYNITLNININSLKNLNTSINQATQGASNFVDKLAKATGQTRNLRGQFKPFLGSFEKLIIVANQFSELIKKIGLLINLLMKPLSEAGLFETFKTTLTNLLGSTDEANNRFKEMVNFAAKTPFTIPGIVEAGNQLQALGRYSLNTLRMLGDLAAASGKDVSQAIDAYTNLVVGRTGIAIKQFRALLITNTDWVREIGKEVLKTGNKTTATITEMLEALPRIIERKNFTGLMDKQSETFTGKMSNLADTWQKFLAKLGDVYLKYAKNSIDNLIKFIENVKITEVLKVIKDLLTILASLLVSKLFTSVTKGVISIFKDINKYVLVNIKNIKNLKDVLSGILLFITRHPLVLGVVAATSVITYTSATKKTELEKLVEEKELIESQIETQQQLREEDIKSLETTEKKLILLKELHDLEYKYIDTLQEIEGDAYQARLSIAEYNKKIAEAKRLMPELVDANDRFTLSIGNVNDVMVKLLVKQESLTKVFENAKNGIIGYTEKLRDLNRELKFLELKTKLEEQIQDIKLEDNIIADIDRFFNSLLGVSGTFKEELEKANIRGYINSIIELAKTDIQAAINIANAFISKLLDLTNNEKIPNQTKTALLNIITNLKSFLNSYRTTQVESFSKSFSDILSAELKNITKGVDDSIASLKKQKEYLEKLLEELNETADPKSVFKNIELDVATASALVNNSIIKASEDVRKKIKELKPGQKINLSEIVINYDTEELRKAASSAVQTQLSITEQSLDDLLEENKNAENEFLSELQKQLSEFKAKLNAIKSEFQIDLNVISNSTEVSKTFDESGTIYEKYIKKYSLLTDEWIKLRKKFFDNSGKILDLKFTDDLAEVDKTLNTYNSTISSELAKIITEFSLSRSKIARESEQLGIKLPKDLFGKDFINIKNSIKSFEILGKNIEKFINIVDDVDTKTQLIELLIKIRLEIQKLYDESYKINFINNSIELLMKNLSKGVYIDFKTGIITLNTNKLVNEFKDSIQKIIDNVDNIYRNEEINIDLPIRITTEDITKSLKTEGLDEVKNKLSELSSEYDNLEQYASIYAESIEDDAKREATLNKLNITLLKSRIKVINDLIQVLVNNKSIEEENAISETARSEKLKERLLIIKDLTDLLKQYNIELDRSNKTDDKLKKEKLLSVFNIITDSMQSLYNGISQIGNLVTQEWINNAKKMADAYLSAQNEMLDFEEKKLLKFARTENQKLKLEENIQKKREEAKEKARKIELEARKKQFEFEKKMAMAQALINIAVAVTKVFSTTGPLGLIVAPAIEALLTSVYLAMISAQEFPEYREGGYTGNKDKKEPAGIVHGQEFVVNAEATKKYRPLLEMINKGTAKNILGYLNGGFVTQEKITNNTTSFIKSAPIIISNNELNTKLDNLNRNIVKYLENPVPSIAYLNDKEAIKITRKGINNLKRYII